MASTTKFTEKAQEAILNAQRETESRNISQFEPIALLLALLDQSDGLVPEVLRKLGVDLLPCARDAATEFDALPKLSYAAQPSLSNSLRKVLQKAEDEAKRMGDEYVSAEHLLLGILDSLETGAAKLLTRFGVTKDRVYEALTQIRGGQRVTDPNPEDKYQALEKYGRDLTELARQGQARSGHWSRRRNPPRDAGPLAPDQEQSGAHWRARRRQDGDRGGSGAAHRAR